MHMHAEGLPEENWSNRQRKTGQTCHSLFGDLSVVDLSLHGPVAHQSVDVARFRLTVPVHPDTKTLHQNITLLAAHTHKHTILLKVGRSNNLSIVRILLS